MARTPQGRSTRAFPVITEGYTDQVWAGKGQASQVDGVQFLVTGEAQKSLGVRDLVKWSPGNYPFGDGRIDATASLKVTNGPDELIVAHGGKVEVVARTETESIATDRSIPRQPSEGENFAAHAGWLFWCNGVDGNQKWNGDYTADVGVSEIPAAPSVVQLEETNFPSDYSIASGATAAVHQYRASFVNSAGQEGPVGPAGGSATIPSGSPTGRLVARITGLDEPVADDILWRNIYKRAADNVYYLWRRVSVTEHVVYDFEPPLATGASGGVVADDTRGPPPTSRLIAFFRGRGYYVPVASPSFIVYSNPGKVEEVPGLNFLEVNSSDGEPITAMVHFLDMLVVFKGTSVWTITARPDGSPVLNPGDGGVGCIAPRSVIRLYKQLLFISHHGVYSFDGASTRPVTNRLNRWWRLLPSDYLVNACAVHDEQKRKVVFAVSSSTHALNDTVLTYHYDIGKEAWAMTRGHRIHSLALYKGMVVAGVEDSDNKANLVVLDGSYSGSVTTYNSENNPDGTATVWTPTGRIRYGPYGQKDTFSAEETLELFGVDVLFRYTGSHSLTLNVFPDREEVVAQTRSFQLNQEGSLQTLTANQDLETRSGWNEKSWGQATWSGDRVMFQRISLPSPVICREFELEFVNDNADEPFEVVSFIPWFSRKGSERSR